MSLAEITGNQHWERSPTAIALAQEIRRIAPAVEVHLALAIVKELDYWLSTNSGQVIDKVRWIYKTITDWWQDFFPSSTRHRVRAALEALREIGVLLFQQPYKNRFDRKAFWSINYPRLGNLAQRGASYTHNDVRTVRTSNTTSTIHLPLNNIPPTPQGEAGQEELVVKEPLDENGGVEPENCLKEVLSKDLAPGSDQDSEPQKLQEEENMDNRNFDPKLGFGLPSRREYRRAIARENVVQRRLPEQAKPSPFKSADEIREFSRQLFEWEMLKGTDQRWLNLEVKRTCDRVEAGEEYVPEWEEFCQGLPMGTLHKQEWEVVRGKPYPLLVEYAARKFKSVEISDEKALLMAANALKNPVSAAAQWEQYKREIEAAKLESDRLRALGVDGDTMPCSLKPLRRTTIEAAADAMAHLLMDNNTVKPCLPEPLTQSLPQAEASTALSLSLSPERHPILKGQLTEELIPAVRARRYALLMSGAFIKKSQTSILDLLKQFPEAREEIIAELLNCERSATWAKENLL